MMRKFFTAVLLVAAALSAQAEKCLVLTYNSGATAQVFLSEDPVITTNATTVMVRAEKSSIDVAFADLSYYDVQDLDPTAVQQVSTDGYSVRRNGSVVTVTGAKSSALYGVSGVCFAQGAGDQRYDLADYSGQVFILSVDGQAYKFVK